MSTGGDYFDVDGGLRGEEREERGGEGRDERWNWVAGAGSVGGRGQGWECA